jgi:CspA family cold shock protein
MGRFYGIEPLNSHIEILMGISIFQKIKQFFSTKPSTNKLAGNIKFFDRKKRFGFIVSGDNEYFFHATATKPKDFKKLQDGASVKFNIINGKKGPQADNVEVC